MRASVFAASLAVVTGSLTAQAEDADEDAEVMVVADRSEVVLIAHFPIYLSFLKTGDAQLVELPVDRLLKGTLPAPVAVVRVAADFRRPSPDPALIWFLRTGRDGILVPVSPPQEITVDRAFRAFSRSHRPFKGLDPKPGGDRLTLVLGFDSRLGRASTTTPLQPLNPEDILLVAQLTNSGRTRSVPRAGAALQLEIKSDRRLPTMLGGVGPSVPDTELLRDGEAITFAVGIGSTYSLWGGHYLVRLRYGQLRSNWLRFTVPEPESPVIRLGSADSVRSGVQPLQERTRRLNSRDSARRP